MKSVFLVIIMVSALSFSVTAQSKVTSEKITVSGNCGMCKAHIEKAAKEAGATSAVWNKDTKILAVKFETTKTSDRQIQQAVADAGYDTKDVRASDAAYNKLDECCQYKRKKQ